MTSSTREATGKGGTGNPTIGLVLAGGGARGAYEIGALSILLPYLESRGERPGIIVGTSIGALNGAYLAATAHLPASKSVESGMALWGRIRYRDILNPFVSPGELGRLLQYFGELLGIPGAEVPSLLDNSPMKRTVRELIPLDQLRQSTAAGALTSVAVVATSYATGESFVFHDSKTDLDLPPDSTRAIRYVNTRLTDVHVRASAAIPGFFPAVRLTEPAAAAGWYGDGGTRLNTPIKPAIKLGARKVVVVGLNSSVTPHNPTPHQPDVFDGFAQYVQAVLADQLTQDVATLVGYNEQIAGSPPADGKGGGHERVPYIFLAPRDRFEVGQLASDIYEHDFTRLRTRLGSRDLSALGHVLHADRNAVRGDLLSFLFFHSTFVDALIKRGRSDAKRWLADVGDGQPWQYVPPSLPEGHGPEPARPSDRLAALRA
jgi:NTE family protein